MTPVRVKPKPKNKVEQVQVYMESDILLVKGTLEAEFNPALDRDSYLAFSDGTVLMIQMRVGEICRIEVEHKGSTLINKTEAEEGEDLESDYIRLDGKLEWCGLMEEVITPSIFS